MIDPIVIERFWSKVDRRGPDECWLWTGGKHDKGYGSFRITQAEPIRAHRFAMVLQSGERLPKGAHVCHRCDNPACVNPAHLFLGSNDDNVKDKVRKGRGTKGPSTGNAKLTEDSAKALMWDRIAGMSHRKLAAKYGVDPARVKEICHGKAWSYLLGTDGAPTREQLLAVPNNRPTSHLQKLTEADVLDIMARLNAGETGRSIARRYGLTFQAISDIKRGHNWSHVTGIPNPRRAPQRAFVR